MYASFFGLKHEPFSIAPDPRYLFMSERHREALAHLLYGVNGGGGFVLLSGEIGAGKTTVCRCFLEQIPRRCNVAYIFNPKLTVLELLQSVSEEFGIPPPPSSSLQTGGRASTIKDYLDPLNEFLLKTHSVGQNNVLIVDEAQMLSTELLEQLRLLTNLETSERKLLQIILIGQPELRDLLAQPELEQLAQRVIARYHLGALTEAETEAYIRHRLSVAGMRSAMPFDAKAMQRIHKLSRGVPRRINLLCDRALLGAYAAGQGQVSSKIVDRAATEVFGREALALVGSRATPTTRRRKTLAWALSCIAIGIGAAAMVFSATRTLQGASREGQGLAAASMPAAMQSSASASATASAASGSMVNAINAINAASTPIAIANTQTASSINAPAANFLSAAALPRLFKTLTRNEKLAWRELAPAWQLTLGEGDPCTLATQAQVLCFRSNGATLALIRQLDRPGILTLLDENGQPVYALLTGLGAQTAQLRIGDVSQTVSLVSLATLWRGDFATFWRAPPGYAGRMVDADSGESAHWLAERLAALRGEPHPPDDALSEGGWHARLAAFQLAQGLKPDGLAGPTTLMQLSRASGVNEPRLQPLVDAR